MSSRVARSASTNELRNNMGTTEDRFEPLVAEIVADDFVALSQKTVGRRIGLSVQSNAAILAKFHSFDLDDCPIISDLPQLPGEVLRARATIKLTQSQIGAQVVLMFENSDSRLPIIVGVLQQPIPFMPIAEAKPIQQVSVTADDDRFVVSAEREIVLRCGDASITLTRAGKVIIKGNYIVSRSTGYNKIKGAAVDIN